MLHFHRFHDHQRHAFLDDNARLYQKRNHRAIHGRRQRRLRLVVTVVDGINAPPEQAGFAAGVGHHDHMPVAARLQAAAMAVQGHGDRITGERLQTSGKRFVTNGKIPQ